MMGDCHFLDDCLGQQRSSATNPSTKDLVTSCHLRKQLGMANRPDNCTLDERTMVDLEVSYNKVLTDHTAGHQCHERGKFHESIFDPAIFPIKSQCEVVTALRHRRLRVALKL